jgi:hypothetical protein
MRTRGWLTWGRGLSTPTRRSHSAGLSRARGGIMGSGFLEAGQVDARADDRVGPATLPRGGAFLATTL